jgi:hypothetical protein
MTTKASGDISLMAQGPSFERAAWLATMLRIANARAMADPSDDDKQEMRAAIGDNQTFARLLDADKDHLFSAMLTEVSDPIMRRAEAGETISQEEVKAAIRISRADCAPVTLPPPPAIKHVSASQSWFAEPPTKEPPLRVLTNADLREVGEKSAGPMIARDLSDVAFQLRRFQSADKLFERLSADEREKVRLGIEAVMGIKAALDRLNQRNAQLHKQRQPDP